VAAFRDHGQHAVHRALIRDNKTFRINSDIQTGAKYGMVTLDGFLLDKYSRA
jgi:twitching motility protein PilT